jgi:hypothetical protein
MSDEGNTDPNEISLPVATVYAALRVYYDRLESPGAVADERIQSIAEGYAYRVKFLAEVLQQNYQVPFEYEHLLLAASSSSSAANGVAVSGSAEDARLRHPLCPPS